MNNQRLDRWKESEIIPALTTFPEDKDFIDNTKGDKQSDIFFGEETDEDAGFSSYDILRAAKELIFDIVDGEVVFHIIMYTIYDDQPKLQLAHALDLRIDNKDKEELRRKVLEELALATALNVPVYPNTDEISPLLANYQRDLLMEGFKIKTSDGQTNHYLLAGYQGELIDSVDYIKSIDLTLMHSPAELHLIKEAVDSELSKHVEAGRLLASLRLAIQELSELLDEKQVRNEHSLQRCLSRNPIIFGLEYRDIVPKYRLGAEYEMDYALIRNSGLVDLVEIEASTHSLFTKQGNPTQHLIHAEQQVLDWLDWIEKHSPYARENLPGLVNPIGYVILGRNKNLSKKDQARLQRRNLVFRDKIRILTFDDLLGNARNLLSILDGTSKQSEIVH